MLSGLLAQFLESTTNDLGFTAKETDAEENPDGPILRVGQFAIEPRAEGLVSLSPVGHGRVGHGALRAWQGEHTRVPSSSAKRVGRMSPHASHSPPFESSP